MPARALLFPLALCAALTAGASSARAAAPLSVPATEPPVLAGDAVVWRSSDHGRQGVQPGMSIGMTTEEGDTRVLAHLPLTEPWSQRFPKYQTGISASPSHYAFIRKRWNGVVEDPGREDISELWAGRLGEPPALVEEACYPTSVEVEDSVVAWSELNACRGGYVILKDLASGADPVRIGAISAGDNAEVQLAGRYVAWWERDWDRFMKGERHVTEVVVYDWRAEREAYRVDMTEIVPADRPHGYGYHFDLQADGKLAVGHTLLGGVGPQPSQLVWFSPEEPYPHEVPVAIVGVHVALADDKLVVCRFEQNDRVLLDLSGRVLASFDRLAPWTACPRASFDGTRIAWINHDREPRVWLDRVPPTPPETHLIGAAPSSRTISFRPRAAGRRLPRPVVSCKAYLRSKCRASAVLNGRVRSGGDTVWRRMGIRAVGLPAGARRPFRVRLNDRARRRLARGRGLVARLRVEVKSPLGESERRVIRLRLRPKVRR